MSKSMNRESGNIYMFILIFNLSPLLQGISRRPCSVTFLHLLFFIFLEIQGRQVIDYVKTKQQQRPVMAIKANRCLIQVYF